MSLNKKYWVGSSKNDKYERAETLFHEMRAHIESNAITPEGQHREYGNMYSGLKTHYDQRITTGESGGWPSLDSRYPAWEVQRGTPAYKIIMQLRILKEKEQTQK
jgi:hypothetical protein